MQGHYGWKPPQQPTETLVINALERLRDKRLTMNLCGVDAQCFDALQGHLHRMLLFPEEFREHPSWTVNTLGARMGFYPTMENPDGFLVQGFSGQEVMQLLANKYGLTLQKVNGAVWMLALTSEKVEVA